MKRTHRDSAEASPTAAATECPACGDDTSVARDIDGPVGGLGWTELDTLVRSEWRRRLGSAAYGRPHRRSFIRAAIESALGPEGTAADEAFREAVWAEVALMEVWGLSRRAAEVELYRLTQAIAAVLERSTLSGSRQMELAERLHRRLCEELEWPAEEWRELQESEGPIAAVTRD